jgi:hypothetical protein
VSKGHTPAQLLALASTSAGRTGRQAEFAAFVGWDKSHVTRLKQLGQLVLTADGLVDYPASLRRIADNADPARDAQRQVAAAKRAPAPESAPAPQPPAPPAAPTPDVDPKYASSRADKEYWAAQTAKLEYEQLVGKVVYRADVDKVVADVTLQFRQALENQPHRLADRLVGLDLAAIRHRLRDDGQEILAELARGFAKRLQQLGQQQGST